MIGATSRVNVGGRLQLAANHKSTKEKGDSELFLNRKKLLTVPFSQKSMRALNVIVRFPVAVVIRPNVVELMFKFGLPQIGLFKILIASVRNVNDRFSPILTFLLKAISKPKDAGPVMPGIFIAVFPVVPGSGFFRTILPELSTTT